MISMCVCCTEDYLATAGGATAVLPSSWPAGTAYQMVPTLYAADAATAAAAAAGGFYNQTAFVPQLAVTQMPQVGNTHAMIIADSRAAYRKRLGATTDKKFEGTTHAAYRFPSISFFLHSRLPVIISLTAVLPILSLHQFPYPEIFSCRSGLNEKFKRL